MTVVFLSQTNQPPMAAAKALNKAANAASVRGVLKLAAAGNLDVLEQAELIKLIAERTTFKARDLRKMLKTLIEDAQLTAPDAPSLLAEAVFEQTFGGNLMTGPDGRSWRFDGTRWLLVSDTMVRKEIAATFRKDPDQFGGGKTKATVDAAYSILRDRCAVETDPLADSLIPTNVINFRNGELWINSAKPEFREHSPASRLTSVAPTKYDPLATCPAFLAALAGIFADAASSDAMVRHLMEVIGYALQTDRKRPKIIVLHGAGANGKSSLLRVVMALLGPDQVYAGSVGRLSQDNFARAALAGKRLFVDDDVKSGITLDDGLLKTISEAKTLTGRRPYGRQEFTFKCIALPMLATNNVPRINDASHGFRRRLMVIPFDRRFEPHEIKPDLFDEIISKELPGIVNAALDGLKRLNERGDFDEPSDCLAAKEAFFALANPLHGFVGERLEACAGGKIPLSELYDALVAWCAHNGIARPFPRNSLRSKLDGMGLTTSKSNGLACLRDMQFRGNDVGV